MRLERYSSTWIHVKKPPEEGIRTFEQSCFHQQALWPCGGLCSSRGHGDAASVERLDVLHTQPDCKYIASLHHRTLLLFYATGNGQLLVYTNAFTPSLLKKFGHVDRSAKWIRLPQKEKGKTEKEEFQWENQAGQKLKVGVGSSLKTADLLKHMNPLVL